MRRRHQQFEAGGIRFHLDVEIGRDLQFGELRARHDAVLIATGVYKSRELAGPGSGLGGIVRGAGLPDRQQPPGPGRPGARLRRRQPERRRQARVVVVGGGDTAMDCVRTAVRQGAASVTCLYRRDKANMPGSMREVKNAEEEGIRFVWLSAPEAFLGDGQVSGVARAAHAAGPARRQRPPGGGAHRPAFHGGGGPGDQGAGLRSGGAAEAVGPGRAGMQPLGHAGRWTIAPP